jgi:hypothetical protein
MSIDAINKHMTLEGGFVDDPRDRGGRTKYGITQTSWDAYNKSKLGGRGTRDVKDLSVEDAQRFYTNYAAAFGLTGLNPVQFTWMLDAAAHSGYYGLQYMRRNLSRFIALFDPNAVAPASWRNAKAGPLTPADVQALNSFDVTAFRQAAFLSKVAALWGLMNSWLSKYPIGHPARKVASGYPRPGIHPSYIRGFINRMLKPSFWEDDIAVSKPIVQAVASGLARKYQKEGNLAWLNPVFRSFLVGYPFRDEVLSNVSANVLEGDEIGAILASEKADKRGTALVN